MAGTCRIVVMASGNGSNFQSVTDAVDSGGIPQSKIVRLFVNRKTAYAATRAEKVGIPSTYFNLLSGGFQAKGEKDSENLKQARAKYDAALADKVLQEEPDLIVCAGWMHVFSASFLQPLAGKEVPIINLHPALPGKYDGANAVENAFRDFQAGKLANNRTGIMIHYVIEEVDRGEPILTKEVECREGDTLHQLEERIHAHEHELIVDAIAKVVPEILAKKTAPTESGG